MYHRNRLIKPYVRVGYQLRVSEAHLRFNNISLTITCTADVWYRCSCVTTCTVALTLLIKGTSSPIKISI